jgi:hypothetical protein
MRRLAIGMVALGLALGPAQASNPAWWMPSPLSIVITVGSWMMKDRVEVFYVRVQAHGRDEADAREQAFRLAVNQAVGSLLLSHTEIKNNEVVRRDIINYSSGHVHDFQILNREQRDGGILIQADVWVRKSQIADRLLSESRAAGQVEGGRISEQISSFRNQKAQADRVIQAVLDDFPQRSFDVAVGNTQVAVDGRQTYLHVPIVLGWNKGYLASMAEALRIINPRPDCGGWFGTCQGLFTVRIGRQRADFEDDNAMFELFHRGLSQKRPVALLKLKSTSNNTVFEACYGVDAMDDGTWSSWKFASVDGYGVRFQEGVVRTTLVLDTQHLDLKSVDRAEVSIIPMRNCPRYPGRR